MKSTVFFLVLLITTFSASAQLDMPVPSPLGKVSQDVGLNTITIEYSRPGVKDRVIFGDLVPYGSLWRTGANARTKITLDSDAAFAGNKIPAGTYGLLTIPGQEEWTIIISKDANSSAGAYNEENDLVRFMVTPVKVTEKVETFTINIAHVRTASAQVELVWENTKVSFEMTTEVDAIVMEQIAKATAGVDPMIYYRSAMYYYDNDKDIAKALEWVNKALENRQTFWMVHGKAKIQAKAGDKAGAIATAKESIKLAEEEGNASYVDLNNKLIEELK